MVQVVSVQIEKQNNDSNRQCSKREKKKKIQVVSALKKRTKS